MRNVGGSLLKIAVFVFLVVVSAVGMAMFLSPAQAISPADEIDVDPPGDGFEDVEYTIDIEVDEGMDRQTLEAIILEEEAEHDVFAEDTAEPEDLTVQLFEGGLNGDFEEEKSGEDGELQVFWDEGDMVIVDDTGDDVIFEDERDSGDIIRVIVEDRTNPEDPDTYSQPVVAQATDGTSHEAGFEFEIERIDEVEEVTPSIEGQTEPGVAHESEHDIDVAVEDEDGEVNNHDVEVVEISGDPTVSNLEEGDVVDTGEDGNATFVDVRFEGEVGSDVEIVFEAEDGTQGGLVVTIDEPGDPDDLSVSIDGEDDGQTVNWEEENTIDAEVTDSAGNPIQGETVTFDQGGDGILLEGLEEGDTEETDENGIAEFETRFFGYNANAIETQFESYGGDLIDGISITMDADHDGDVDIQTPIFASDEEFDIVTSNFEELNTEPGDPFAGDLGIEIPGFLTTTEEDIGETTFTEDVPNEGDTIDVTLTADGELDSDETEVLADPDEIRAEDDTATADGEDEAELTVTIEDDEGDPIEGVQVEVNDDDGVDGIDAGDTERTDENGEVTFTATSTDAEDYTIEFEEESGYAEPSTTTATASFEAGDPADLTAEVTDDEAVADGEETVEFTITLEDEYGNPVEGETIIVDEQDDELDFVGDTEPETGEQGEASFEATSDEPGEYTATFALDDEEIELDDEATATFTEQVPDDLTVVSSPDDIEAGQEFDIVIQVEDESGNEFTGELDGFTLDSEFDNGLAFTPESPIDMDGAGRATITIQENEVTTADDSHTITADANEVDPNDFTVDVSPSDPILDVTADPDEALADDDEQVEFEVIVEDEYGNTFDTTVSVNDADGLDAMEDESAETGGDGEATFTATSDTPDTHEVEFVEGESEDTDTATVTFTEGDINSIDATVEVDEAIPDDEDQVEIAVSVETESGDPGDTTVEVTDTDGLNFEDEDLETGGDGEATFAATSSESGEFTPEFEAETDVTDTATVTFLEIDADATLREEDEDVEDDEARVGDTYDIRVTVEDENEDPVDEQEVTVTDIENEDAIEGLAEDDDATISDGFADFGGISFEDELDETVTISFETIDDTDTALEVTIAEPGDPDALVVAIAEETEPEVSIGLEQSIDALLMDAAGNPIPGAPVSFMDAQSDDDVEIEGLEQGDSSETDSEGIATFEAVVFQGDEDDTIDVTFSHMENPVDTMTVSLVESAPADISAETTEDDAIADGSDQVEFAVTVLNEAGDPVEDTTVEVDDAADVDSLGGLSAGDTASTDEDGVTTFTATSTTIGDFDVQFSEAEAGTDTTSATFVEEPDPEEPDEPEQAHFDVTITSTNAPVAPGETVDIDVTVTNTGEFQGQQDIELAVAAFEATETVSLGGESDQQLSFEWDTTNDDIGTHDVTVESFDDSDTASVEVGADPPEYVSSVVEDDAPQAIEITFDEDVSLESETAGFAVDLDGTPVDIVDASASADTVTLSLGEEVAADHSVSLSYDGESDNVVNEYGIEALPFSEVDTTVDVSEPMQANLTAIDPTTNEPGDEFSLSVTTEDGVQFSAADSIVPEGDATYEWEVGGETFTTDEPELSEQLLEPGTYSASVTVTVDGVSDTADFTLTVEDDTPPDAVLTAEEVVEVGEDPGFDATDSTDNVEIAEYRWDFDDGITDAGADLTQPEHAFDEPGEYTVELTVVDTSDNEATTTVEVVVDEDEDGGIGATEGILLLLLLLVLAAGTAYYYMRRRR